MHYSPALIAVATANRLSLCRKMLYVRRNCDLLQPQIRTADLQASACFLPSSRYLIRPTASASPDRAPALRLESTMPTRGLFLLFTHAGAVALMILLNGAAGAAACLVAPNRTPAEGEHWYYRTKRETNQKCWYLGARDVATTGTMPTPQGTQVDVDISARSKTKPLTTSEQEALFRDFLRWKKQREMQ
jgi:hypothetical protein